MKAYIKRLKLAGFGQAASIEKIEITNWTIEEIEAWLKKNSPYPSPREKFIKFNFEHYGDN